MSYPLAPGYFCGWLHPPVQLAVHGAPPPPEPAVVEEKLPVNRSGSARTEGFKRRAVVRIYTAEDRLAGGATGAGGGVKRPRPQKGQKEVAMKRMSIPGQPQQLSRWEKPWCPPKRRSEIASQVGKVLRTEHCLRAKQGALQDVGIWGK